MSTTFPALSPQEHAELEAAAGRALTNDQAQAFRVRWLQTKSVEAMLEPESGKEGWDA